MVSALHQSVAMENLSGNPTSLARRVPQKWQRFLFSRRGRIFQAYQHLFVFNIYHVVRKIYKKRYKIPVESRSDSGARQSSEWHWRDLPRLHPFWFWYRVATSTYFVYVVVKYMAPGSARFAASRLGLDKPAHCYMLGRFVIFDMVGEVYATCFAIFHLVWRMFQRFDHQPISITSFFFVILEDCDIQLYYRLMSERTRRTAQSERFLRLPTVAGRTKFASASASAAREGIEAKTAMMHDIMSSQIDWGSHVTFKLRPNRTAHACRKLRDFLTLTTVLGGVVFTLIATVIELAMLIYSLDDRWFLKQYPDCDSELERMFHEGVIRLDQWSFHGTRFQLMAYAVDTIENWFLWSESGIVYYSCITCTLFLNFDLMAHWRHLSEKIDCLLNLTRAMRFGSSASGVRVNRTRRKLARELDESIFELQMEIRDFFRLLRRHDHLIGDMTTTVINVWFTLFAYFIYSSMSDNRQQHMSIALVLTILAAFTVTSLVCFLVTSVHRNCRLSYVKLCSLMALDESRHKQQFTGILDYFNRQQTCYTVFRNYNMTATTYLTIVGYSFSCFFVLSSVNKGH